MRFHCLCNTTKHGKLGSGVTIEIFHQVSIYVFSKSFLCGNIATRAMTWKKIVEKDNFSEKKRWNVQDNLDKAPRWRQKARQQVCHSVIKTGKNHIRPEKGLASCQKELQAMTWGIKDHEQMSCKSKPCGCNQIHLTYRTPKSREILMFVCLQKRHQTMMWYHETQLYSIVLVDYNDYKWQQ